MAGGGKSKGRLSEGDTVLKERSGSESRTFSVASQVADGKAAFSRKISEESCVLDPAAKTSTGSSPFMRWPASVFTR